MPSEAEEVMAWRIEPLPDFLLDHTLTETECPARLREVVGRWVQFIGTTWRWSGRASFALRFQSDGRQVRTFLLARAAERADREAVQEALEALMRTHGLPAEPEAHRDPSDPASSNWNLGGQRVYAEVRQHQSEQLWTIPARAAANPQVKKALAWLPEAYWTRTPSIFPWWAPGGPFLLPMEELVSQSVPCSMTVHLEPTRLTREEWDWMAFIARTAQSVGDFQAQALDQAMAERRVDPAASLAGRLAMANLRRLADKPFLVSVQCVAGSGAVGVARSLAGTIESIVYERPFDRPSQEDDRLPSAADVLLPGEAPDVPGVDAARTQYDTLRFPDLGELGPLWRMPYLVDARGAATAFRLPVNVRGGVPGCRISQRPPDFHPGPRERELPKNHILIGELHQGGIASVHRDQFTKHALVTGFTGSGKTVTVQSLVHQLHESGIPVLVLESAKHEYRSLLRAPAFRGEQPLWIFSAGNEACSPLRLNPFELLPGTRVEAHVSRLQTCFEAALPPIGPLASMIGEALVDVYQRNGWRLTDVGPEIGERLPLPFPTMQDFYRRMSDLFTERGYEGEVRSNVSAAVLGRIKPLTIGTKGLLFRSDHEARVGAPRKPSLISTLFERSTVVEMNDLNLEDKALVTMFLLTFLREHRERHASPDGSLVHAAVVEEAHNVLENVSTTSGAEGGAADTRFKAVQAFSQLLTEIRALGQSLIIVDQSPEKLAPDALRNTNIQIAHQLRDSKDRESIARAMIMEDEQRDYLGKLVPGQAAMFVTGLERATYVQVPRYVGDSPAKSLEAGGASVPAIQLTAPSDVEVREHMADVIAPFLTGPFDDACRPCPVRATCDHRKPVLAAMGDGEQVDRFAHISNRYRRDRSTDRGDTVRRLVACSVDTARQTSQPLDESVVWCAFVHLWHGDSFNWSESFPTYGYETLMSVLEREHNLTARKEAAHVPARTEA